MLKDNIRGDLADMILVQSTRPHTRVHRAPLPEQNNQRRLHRVREEEQRAADDLRRQALLRLIATSCLSGPSVWLHIK